MSDAGTITGTSDWRSLCKVRKAVQDASIPEEWKIKVPPDASLDVRSVTEDCGLLSARELDIVDLGTKDVSALVRLLADKDSGYTSLEVSTAYLKSAIVAHQAVSLCSVDLASRVYQTIDSDELPHGNLRRACPRSGKRSRPVFGGTRGTYGSLTRLTDLIERSIYHERLGDNHGY
jgi:hypothetical protein